MTFLTFLAYYLGPATGFIPIITILMVIVDSVQLDLSIFSLTFFEYFLLLWNSFILEV